MSSKMVFTRYDYASFMVFTAYAMGSMIIPMCLVSVANELSFPLQGGGMGLGGALQLGRSVPIIITLLLCGFFAAKFGNRIPVGIASMTMGIGIMIAADANSYMILFCAMAVAGLGEGVVEGLATPLVNDLHPEEPGRYINFAHSFWAVGIVLATLLGGYLLELSVSWRLLTLAVGIFGIIAATILFIPNKKAPKPLPHATGGVLKSAWTLLKIPRFYLYLSAMLLTGSGEFGITFWCPSFVQLSYASSSMMGGLVTAALALGMIVSRMGGGIFVKEHQMAKYLICAALLSTLMAILPPLLNSVWILIAVLFLAGVGAGPLWPTIQSRCAARVGGDSTMVYILLSALGICGSGIFSALLGMLGDRFGLRTAFAVIPFCFILVALLIWIDYRNEQREKKNIDL